MEIAVCDDDMMIVQQVCRLVDKILGEECCRIYTDGEEILKGLEKGHEFDVIIMDIEWDGEERGIQFAEKLNRLSPETQIIYLTGYTQKYVQKIFLQPSNLSGFLMKPVDEEILRVNLQKIKAKKQKYNKEKFVIRQKGATFALRYEEMTYLESAGHKITVFTRNGTYSCYDKLETLAETFPKYFVYCHKSYLVNMNEIHSIEPGRHVFVMNGGEEIPISKARYGETRRKFFDYIRERALSCGG